MFAIVRIILGTLQVMGATMALMFLLGTGASVLTTVTIAVTLSITLVSWCIFGRARR